MNAPVIWPNGGIAFPVYWRDDPDAPFRWTSAFGMRTHPVTGQPSTFHYGLDLVGWSDILAPATGTVTFAGYNGGAGNEVRIRADGPNAFVKGTVFRLLHNRSLNVRTGDRVTQGQKVAVMGTTGSSTGVHCHLETRPNGGAAIDPVSYYRSALAGFAGTGSDTIITNQSEEDEMPIIIVQKKGKPNEPKGQMLHNRRMRLITKYENTAYRKAQAQSPDQIIYVDLTDAEFNSLLAGKA